MVPPIPKWSLSRPRMMRSTSLVITAAGVDGVEVDTQAQGCRRPITAQEGCPRQPQNAPYYLVSIASAASALNVVCHTRLVSCTVRPEKPSLHHAGPSPNRHHRLPCADQSRLLVKGAS